MLNGTTITTRVRRDGQPRSEKLTEAIARAWLDECARSEMTQSDFARSKGVSPQCLSGWKMKLLRSGTTPTTAKPKARPKRRARTTSSGFVPIALRETVVPHAAAAPAVPASRHVMYEIVLGTAFTVRVPSDFHEGELARLLRTLAGAQ
jgi:hypothetical protein